MPYSGDGHYAEFKIMLVLRRVATSSPPPLTPPPPPVLNLLVPIYTPGWRDTVRIKCLAQELNTMSLARARTQTARSED